MRWAMSSDFQEGRAAAEVNTSKGGTPMTHDSPLSHSVLQGMSAKQEAEILVDSLSSTDHIVVTREQYEYLVSAIAIGFTNREAAARNEAIEDAVEVCAAELDAEDLAYRLRELKLPETQPVERKGEERG